MTLGEFRKAVYDGYQETGEGLMGYFGIESKNHKWEGLTGNLFVNNWATINRSREGKGHDWGLTKEPVLAIKIVQAYGRSVPVAVID